MVRQVSALLKYLSKAKQGMQPSCLIQVVLYLFGLTMVQQWQKPLLGFTLIYM